MKSCILTIIKNEQEYLDEWIKYHLDLGINHIFIFEDIDSESHKEITDKYRDAVSLNSISSILSEEELQTALNRKITKAANPQFIYIKNGLQYIKQNFSYDWCFVIDNDEFITLENQTDTLNHVLSLYNNYDALILSWKCYGANGYIKKPDYSRNGILTTYISPINGYVPLSDHSYNKKTCYNLSTYDESFWKTNHTPNNICNFCNSEFVKDINKITYKNIYLRHYITKSWEEYYWKKKSRGYFMGFVRDLDAFFKMNQDLLPKRSQILSEPDEDAETLVVLPYVQGNSQGEEIRIALTAWKKFCKFKYRFLVVGEFDGKLIGEFPWVVFIPVKTLPKKDNQYSPHLDILNKFNIIYNKYKERYAGFIYMVDDNYAIKPFTLKDITTVYYHSSSFTGDKTKPTSWWKNNKYKTRQLLDQENLPHINYTTHFPYYMNFERLHNLCEKYNLLEESYVFDDIYFNSFDHEKPILDSTIRLGVWNQEIFKNDFQKAVENPDIKFVCNSVEGWSKELEESLWEIITG